MSDLSRHPEAAPDRQYFASRAEAERMLAANAIDERARAIHQQLADEYAAKAQDGVAND
jgi:hypothetical protein